MTGPLPLPSPSGVRVAGDRYQWLVAWHACLTVLRDAATGASNPAVSVGVEVDDVGNVDDVVLRRRLPPHSYRQVKYAVDGHTPVSGGFLTAASRTGGPSTLAKIAAAWRQLTSTGDPVELALITNRAPDPADPLIAGRDARTRLLLPRAGDGGPGSARGKERAAWAKAAGLTEAELLDLLAVLDFDLARDRMHLEETVKLTMFAAGLRSDDLALAAGADWVAEQVVAGRRELDLDAIQHAVSSRALHSGPTRTIVSIATLAPDRLAAQAAYAIDWVDRFDGSDAYAKRRPKAPATWQQLQADIETIPSRLDAASHVAITGSLRLAPAFTTGAALRMVTSTDIAVMQRGTPWASDAPYSAPMTPASTEYAIGQGQDVAIAIEVATSMTADVQAFLQDRQIPVSRLVVLGPPEGPRDNAIAGPEQACAQAVGLRDAARRAAHRHPRVHLFLATPMGLALLLGHRWNRVAPTIVYEDLAALGYEAAFTVSA
ncbi:MAG: SAVED domain-containing protein [Streptosporangiaceae bacterium]